ERPRREVDADGADLLPQQLAVLGERGEVQKLDRQPRAVRDAGHAARHARALALLLPPRALEEPLGLGAIERRPDEAARVRPLKLARDRRRRDPPFAEEHLTQERVAI